MADAVNDDDCGGGAAGEASDPNARVKCSADFGGDERGDCKDAEAGAGAGGSGVDAAADVTDTYGRSEMWPTSSGEPALMTGARFRRTRSPAQIQDHIAV